MKIIRDVDAMRELGRTLRSGGKTIALVPTMGALHKGHLSLLTAARQQCDYAVVSIFVNPTQFGLGEDFECYPRPFARDCAVAERHGCDIIFAPEAKNMYPKDYQTSVIVKNITQKLEGASRPEHFEGVTTVVTKLFNAVGPDAAIFGQKDAQQVLVIKRMVADLNVPVRLVVRPTVREDDGLALSSRNAYLTADERRAVPLIHAGLSRVTALYEGGERSALVLLGALRSVYERTKAFKVEYTSIVDTRTLNPVDYLDSTVLVAVACRTVTSRTRLIDNIVLGGLL
ncbi:MAG: pantoate--beta-alanine ligase [Chitinivibrionales bacterium]|nr:pantoate--beta-alanine ligase [Chitinivibrionales bacterium]MBD3357456.1 pantoate--beta-alanine ligase [Chitinivibrionales bacterium]